MNVLLDTHTLLWWLRDSRQLGKRAKALIRAGETLVWVSSVSIWEISIKAALGRLDLLEPFEKQLHAEMERSGFRELAITFAHMHWPCESCRRTMPTPSTACRSPRLDART